MGNYFHIPEWFLTDHLFFYLADFLIILFLVACLGFGSGKVQSPEYGSGLSYFISSRIKSETPGSEDPGVYRCSCMMKAMTSNFIQIQFEGDTVYLREVRFNIKNLHPAEHPDKM
jgi:hypothetical protein